MTNPSDNERIPTPLDNKGEVARRPLDKFTLARLLTEKPVLFFAMTLMWPPLFA